MRYRFFLFAVIGVLLFAVAEWNHQTRSVGALNALEDFWLEFSVGNSGDRFSDPAVTVVRISDDYEPLNIGTEDETGASDLTRLDYATILGFVSKLNPTSVAFLPTPVFDESRVLNQTDIVPLKDAAMQLPKLVVATSVSDDGENAKEVSPIDYPGLTVEGAPDEILAFTRTLNYPDPQILANGYPAFKDIESAGGLITDEQIRLPLVARYKGKVVPSLVLLAVANHAGIKMEEIVVDLTGARDVVRIGAIREVPIAEDGTMLLSDHAGMRRSMKSRRRNADGEMASQYHFTSLKVDELAYTGQENDDVAKRILADLQDKFESLSRNIVVIGFDRTADRRYTTEKGEVLSETNLLARAIGTIQSGRFIVRWPFLGRVLGFLIIAGLAAVLFSLRRSRLVPGVIVASFLYLAGMVLLFQATLTWNSPFLAMACFVVVLLIGMLTRKESGAGESATASLEN